MEETTAYAKGIAEAILFVSDKPVTVEQFRGLMDGFDALEIKKALRELQQDCEDQRRGMVIVEIAGGYQMLSSPHYVSYVRNFFKTRVKEKLSRPALETLAIISYKQPVSRADIEMIRGVNSDGVVNHLLNKSLIKVVGRKDVPGRPFIYGTTKEFLEYFGLKSLKDMPKLDDLADELTQAALNEAKAEAGILPADDVEASSSSEAAPDGEPADENLEASGPDSVGEADSAQEPSAMDLKQAMDEVSHQDAEQVNPARARRLPAEEREDAEETENEPLERENAGDDLSAAASPDAEDDAEAVKAAVPADEDDINEEEEPAG